MDPQGFALLKLKKMVHSEYDILTFHNTQTEGKFFRPVDVEPIT